ncbi:hypothetical protein C1646_674775 [Rhizophagus diaphanus]|nr:hypothetical protein C1646_674775 [Rhizophagus diaphanus] [Rhizophagus sp. MUCL 43196]
MNNKNQQKKIEKLKKFKKFWSIRIGKKIKINYMFDALHYNVLQVIGTLILAFTKVLVEMISCGGVEEVEDGNNPQANGGAGDSKKGFTKELQDVYNDLSPKARIYCNVLEATKIRRSI